MANVYRKGQHWGRGKTPPLVKGVETNGERRDALRRLGQAKGAAKRRERPAIEVPSFDDFEREERRRGRA